VTAPARPPRFRFLDACRGLAVIAMLAANLVNVYLHRTPWLLRHNEGDVLRPFDLPAPTFQFLVGVSLALFLRARGAAGRTGPAARRDAFRRFALLVLLGMLLDCVGALGMRLRWGVLQTLGVGGAIAAALSPTSTATIVAVALLLLGMFSGAWNGEVHGDPVAGLAFVPLTLAGLVLGRALDHPRPLAVGARRAAEVAVVAGALAAVLYALGIPFNKLAGTSSFVALSTAAAAAFVGATAALEGAGAAAPTWVAEVGRNALTAWVLQYLLVFYPAWLAFPAWRRLPLWPGLAAVGLTIFVLCALAVGLGRRGIRIPL